MNINSTKERLLTHLSLLPNRTPVSEGTAVIEFLCKEIDRLNFKVDRQYDPKDVA